MRNFFQVKPYHVLSQRQLVSTDIDAGSSDGDLEPIIDDTNCDTIQALQLYEEHTDDRIGPDVKTIPVLGDEEEKGLEFCDNIICQSSRIKRPPNYIKHFVAK